MKDGPGRHLTVPMAILLFLATALLFGRTATCGFLDFDDPDYVTANEHVQAGLTWPGIRWVLVPPRPTICSTASAANLKSHRW